MAKSLPVNRSNRISPSSIFFNSHVIILRFTPLCKLLLIVFFFVFLAESRNRQPYEKLIYLFHCGSQTPRLRKLFFHIFFFLISITINREINRSKLSKACEIYCSAILNTSADLIFPYAFLQTASLLCRVSPTDFVHHSISSLSCFTLFDDSLI